MPELELAMLRRSVDQIAAGCERCRRCRRTPLVGERVYFFKAGEMLCELCRALRRDEPESWQLVLNSKAGHAGTIRIMDRRAAV